MTLVQRLGRNRVLAIVAVLVVVAGVIAWVVFRRGESYRVENRMLAIASGPQRDQPITIDTTLYVPESTPAPAVLLAHGFGGTKDSVASSAKKLAAQGYVVLAYSARGFGRSGGTISLQDPDYEINDARALVDFLATRPEVQRDGANDPRVGVAGGSYGGSLALMLAGYDNRVDAIVPQITWNNLANVFFPQSSGPDPESGVFKKAWAGTFFGNSGGPQRGGNVQCGRFSREICDLFLDVATTGRATPAAVSRLERNSPAPILGRIAAPTLLIQGQADSLFPLSESDANARGIAANGTPVRTAWYSGGHDDSGSDADTTRLELMTLSWFDHYLKGEGSVPANDFTYTVNGALDLNSGRATVSVHRASDYPGLENEPRRWALSGGMQQIANPPGGNPASISSIPGFGSFGGLAVDVPGQFAAFDSEPFAEPSDVVGSSRVSIKVASPTGEAVLFLKLYDVSPDGRQTLPQGLVAPVRLTGLASTMDKATPVTITLPAIAHRFEADHRARLVIASSDQAYASPVAPTVYQVELADAAVAVPSVDSVPATQSSQFWLWTLLGALLAVIVGVIVTVVVVRIRHRRSDRSIDADAAGSPLVIRGLRKAYKDGYLAVRDLSFRVEPGQVVGLLGPNGAGKTTTLRMLMGLIRPSAGEILVYGHRVAAGAPVLSRLGSFVEGSGFLPHLSGLDNLHAYWRATGRPYADAGFDEVLKIAGLGSAIHRRVKTYSQGMRQRLAIAQAMLGMPDLLVLDEPTNGLDPPQIHQMRDVLRDYATDGRAVLVSSHLLSEVEQTCSHVVVVHHGELVASGPVDEVVGRSRSVLIELSKESSVDIAVAALQSFGVTAVQTNGRGIIADLDGIPRSELVRSLVEAGVGVEEIASRRRLEEVFLALVGEDG